MLQVAFEQPPHARLELAVTVLAVALPLPGGAGAAVVQDAQGVGIDAVADERADGGRTSVRSTMVGAPLPSSVETSASPVPSAVMASAALKAGLGRNVSAADFTAFCSRGV